MSEDEKNELLSRIAEIAGRKMDEVNYGNFCITVTMHEGKAAKIAESSEIHFRREKKNIKA